jgi:hypothetical protein
MRISAGKQERPPLSLGVGRCSVLLAIARWKPDFTVRLDWDFPVPINVLVERDPWPKRIGQGASLGLQARTGTLGPGRLGVSVERRPYRETEMVNEVSVCTPAWLKHCTKTAEVKPARSATVQKRGPVEPVVSVSGWTIRNQPLVA